MRIPAMTRLPRIIRASGSQSSVTSANATSTPASTIIASAPATSAIALKNSSRLNQNVIQRWRSANGSARFLYHTFRRSKPVWNQAR